MHTPYGQKDDAGPIGGIGGSNLPSGGSNGGGSSGDGSFHDQSHLGPDHGNITPQPEYDPYGGYGGNSYVPQIPEGLNHNFGDQLYLNEGNDSEGYDPYADQADPVAPTADPDTVVCKDSKGFIHRVPKGGSHGIKMLQTGDSSNAPAGANIEAKIALAAVNGTDAIIQEDG